MSETYTASQKTVASRPRSKRLRETGKVSTSSSAGAQAVAGETYWQKSTDEDGNDIIKASMGAQVTKTVYLVTEDGTKVATMSIDENGRFVFNKGIISKEDIVAYGVEGDDIDTVEELIDERIEANPTGSATDDMATIRIGNVIYNVAGGGGAGVASISLTLNQTDYKMQASITDNNGDTITSNVIDFPIESVVVGGSYDSTNKNIILTLKNGSTVTFSVADLVSGLASTTYVDNSVSAYLPLSGGTMTGMLKLQDISYYANNTKTNMNGGIQSDSAVIGVRSDGSYYRPHILSGDGNIVFGISRYDANKWGFLGCDTNGKITLRSCKSNAGSMSVDASGNAVATGDVTAGGSFGASTTTSNDRYCSIENSNGKIALLTATNRGVYDTTKNTWLIATNGTNTWLSDGNVGVGTTSPSEKLSVNGNINISSVASSSRNWLKIGGVNRISNYESDINATVFRGSKFAFDDHNANDLVWIDASGNLTAIGSLTTTDTHFNTTISEGDVMLINKMSSGGWARGLYVRNSSDTSTIASIAMAYGNGQTLNYIYYGGGYNDPWFKLTSSGGVFKGDVTAYSDARLKSDIKPLEYRGSLEPREYIKDGKKSIGFIAQEVRKIYPELVLGEESDTEYLSLNYGAITAVLAAENKMLKKKIESLEDRLVKIEDFLKGGER